MDNFHGKNVDIMQSAWERTASFPTYGNLDPCQHVQGHSPDLEEHAHALLQAQLAAVGHAGCQSFTGQLAYIKISLYLHR